MTIQEVQRKARYGRRDWVFWKDHAGTTFADLESAETLKQAMLAVGTRGRFYAVSANTGTLTSIGWRQAVTYWRNARRLWLTKPAPSEDQP